MRIDEFQQRLRDSVLIADGAMGSYLYETSERSAAWMN